MNVQAIDHRVSQGLLKAPTEKPSEAHSGRPSSESKIKEMRERPNAESAPAGDLTGEGVDEQRPAGVLRLLESGHFKGVADVRLRINFYEELAAKADTAAQAALPGQAEVLVHAIDEQSGDQVMPFAGSEEVRQGISEALNTFRTAVQGAVETSTASGRLDRETLAVSIRGAFDSLLSDIRATLSPQSEESAPVVTDDPAFASQPESSDGTVPETVDGSQQITQTSTPSLDEALATLADRFTQALDDLLGFVDTALQLPAPSAPTGNGLAYEKFLAMYDELKGGTSDIDTLA